MRQAALLAVNALICAGCDGSEAPGTEVVAASQHTRYSARAFFETTSFSLSGTPAWSVDGTRLLIGSDETGIVNVYALNVDGSGRTALTDSTESPHRPVSWFPNDDRVLFMVNNKGDELDHLYVRETTGEVRDLTPGENLKAGFLGWSGDGGHFYVLSTERDPSAFDVYRYSAADYARELVFENRENWFPTAMSGSGGHLVLVRRNSSSDSDVYLLDLRAEGVAPVHITPHEGEVSYGFHDFLPDESGVVYATNEHGEFTQAWRYDLESGERAPLIVEDWDVVFAAYSDSGRYLVYGVNEDARVRVTIQNVATGERVGLPGLPEGHRGQIRFSRDDSKIALNVSTDTSPRDIYVVDRATGSSRRLTFAPNPQINEGDLVGSEVIRYRSFDGLEIPGILYRPKGASAESPVPALVWVHGGPGGQSGRGYNPALQHLVNHGYAVLAANNRGSSGYGKSFFHMDDRRHGEVDLDDIVFAEKYLAGLDWVDASRIGIIGGSYGGYMVGAALAFRPDVFKVGINIFGVMNWLRTLESMPPWWEAQRKALYDELGDPATDAERLRRISPLFHAENIRVPLLVVQGANDPRVLRVESDEIVAAVRKGEVPVEYIVFDDEGHGFAQRENRITASDAYVKFLDSYL